jgi:hypothetical protein
MEPQETQPIITDLQATLLALTILMVPLEITPTLMAHQETQLALIQPTPQMVPQALTLQTMDLQVTQPAHQIPLMELLEATTLKVTLAVAQVLLMTATCLLVPALT